MPARTGAQYIQGLRDRSAEVWIGGERVSDVTSYPGLRNGVQSLASLLDMQHDPALQEELTYLSPTTGDRVGLSFITPKCVDDLERRRRMMTRWARASCGMMGRSPDFLNVVLMAMAAAGDYFAQNRPEFKGNIQRYYEFIRENDLVVTHSLDNVRRQRLSSSQNPNSRAGDVMLKVVKETDAGIIVHGCRTLATKAPISDEIAVYPIRPELKVEHGERYAMAFAIPCDTSGLKFLCRESFDYDRPNFDHPLGSRFEEMDALVFFDNVLVPWERVFLLGDVELCDGLTRGPSFLAHGDHHSVTRQVAKSEFLLGLASLMVETLGSGDQPHVQERLGELILYLEVMKAGLRAAEVDAKPDPWGVTTPRYLTLASVRSMYARVFNPRMVEIIQLLGSSSLMALPSSADFDSGLRSVLDKYLATDTADALDRTRLFHLAWDISCSAFGSRQVHYERNFAGDPVRNALALNGIYDKNPAQSLVQQLFKQASLTHR